MSGRSRSTELLAPFLRRQWPALAVAAGSSVAVAGAELARPFPIKLVIDRLFSEQHHTGISIGSSDLPLIFLAGGLVLLIALVDAAASYLVEVRLERAGERIVHDLRTATYSHLQRLSMAYHQRRHTGDLVTRVTGDVNAVGELFSDSLGTLVSSLLLLIGMLVVSLVIDPVLAVAAFAITPVLARVAFVFRSRVKTAARRQREKEGEIASISAETLGAMREIKALGSERFEVARMDGKSAERLDAGIDAVVLEGRFTGLVDLLGAVGSALVLVVGVFRVASGALTPGDLVVMNSYVRRLYRPLRDIARQASRVSRSMARADRIAEVLATEDILADRPRAWSGGRAKGDLALEGVSFAHTPGRPALAGVTLEVPAGERVAVVGRSGAGKSTLGALVARFFDPTEGRVLLDGHDLRACKLDWLRSQVGLVLQDTVLFSGTVAENIAYGTDAPRDAIVAAAKTAGAHAFISTLPEGYDTELGPRAVGLSGGQRQRIAIARTLLRDPPLLILDEPTAGLDAESEAEVLRGLDLLMRGRTTIVMTHALALALTADRVIVLDAGRIAQEGAPEDLLLADGPFRQLADLQGLVDTAPRRSSAPADPALKGLDALLDEVAMGEVLGRGVDGGASVDVRLHCLRYKPATNAVVHYDVAIDGRWHHATAMIATGDTLAARASREQNQELARRAAGRAPVSEPLRYEPDIGVLVQWLPLDLRLPALAEDVETLAGWLRHAGLKVSADETSLLHYKPRRRAVMRVGGLVVKIYASDDDFVRAAAGLRSAARIAGLSTGGFRAALPNQRLTVQSIVPGKPCRAASPGVAASAGRALTVVHRASIADIEAHDSKVQLTAAVATANLVVALAPELTNTVHRLVARLEAEQPHGLDLVPSHGDFHVGQLLLDRSALAVIDFDEMCLAPPALDLGSYAAHLVLGERGDLRAAAGSLASVVDGYGHTPDGLPWYVATSIVRRATVPFRTQAGHWRDRVESMLRAAESALDL